MSEGFNMPVSETEKRGGSSGYRFSEKAGPVPIKKRRRFLVRSPSPPLFRTSPCAEETADHMRSQDVSDKVLPLQSSSSVSQIVEANNSIGAEKSDKFNERFGEEFANNSIKRKRRRFLFRTPSPPPFPTSPCAEESADHTRSQDVSDKVLPLQSSSSVSQIVEANNGIGAKKSDKFNERFCEDEDFSGISILAAAACSSSLGSDCGYAEDGTGIEESLMLEREREVFTNTETQSSSKALSKEDVINSSEMSSGATSSCISTEPPVDLASISTTVNSSQKVATIGKGFKDASLGVDSLTSSSVSCDKDDNTVRTQRPSFREDRLHWDLNVVMEAWEQPFDDPSAQIDVDHNISEDVGKFNHTHDMKLEGHYLQDNLESAYVAQSCLLPGEPKGLAKQSSCEIKGKRDMDAHNNLNQPLCSGVKLSPIYSNPNLEVTECTFEDTKCGSQMETVNPTDGQAVAAVMKTQPTSLCTIFEAGDASVKDLNLNDNPSVKGLNLNDNCDGYQPLMGALKSNVGMSCQLQNFATIDTVSADTDIGLRVSSNSDSPKEFKQNVAVPEIQETPKMFRHDVNSLREDVDMKTVEPLEHTRFAISDNDGLPKTETPNTISQRCELPIAIDTKLQDVNDIQGDNIDCNNGIVNNLSATSGSTPKGCFDSYYEETCKINSDHCSISSENIDHKESFKLNSDGVVQCHPALVDGTDAAGELREVYDSQFEDGELRESGGHVWEDYDAVDRVAENTGDHHVSDCRQVEDRKSGILVMAPPVSFHDSNIDNKVDSLVAEVVGNERGHVEADRLTSSPVVEKEEPTQGNELSARSKNFSDMESKGADDSDIRSQKPIHFDGLISSRSTETRADPKAFRRGGLQSQIEAPVDCDDPNREEHVKKMDKRFDPGPIRSFERMRYPFPNHGRGRGRQGGSWDGSSDGRSSMRRHYSPIIHGDSKVDDDAVVERDDLGCVDTQDDLSYSKQIFRKPQAGAEGDPYSGSHSRYKAFRKFSPDRSGGFGRGRPFRYGPFVEGRGGRGRFNGPSSDETFQSSLQYRRPISRRERSISPFGGRGLSNIHPFRRKSPSQSRSRSPVWDPPRRRLGAGRGGNAFLGSRSRSPNFRSDTRMQRLRSPHQQPGFGGDHSGEFRSFSRNNCSPPRNRWSSARKDEQGQFRELGYKQRTFALDRSPGRIRLRCDRGSAIDSPQNLKPDGYNRMSDRFPDDSDRVRCDENFEERRKQYDPFCSTRRNYDNGIASRLRLNKDDSFPMANHFRERDASTFQDRGLRNIDSRIGDVPRRFRGENHSFNYERDV